MVQPLFRLNKLIQYCFPTHVTGYLVFVQKNRRDSTVTSTVLPVRLQSCIVHALDWLLYPLICKKIHLLTVFHHYRHPHEAANQTQIHNLRSMFGLRP